jgi:hypothetical protein
MCAKTTAERLADAGIRGEAAGRIMADAEAAGWAAADRAEQDLPNILSSYHGTSVVGDAREEAFDAAYAAVIDAAVLAAANATVSL